MYQSRFAHVYPPPENPLSPHNFKPLTKYIAEKMRQAKNANPAAGVDIGDEIKDAIVFCAFVFIEWCASTDDGSAWLYGLSGIEEVQKHLGFDYFLCSDTGREAVDPTTGYDHMAIYSINPIDQNRSVSRSMVVELHKRAYRKDQNIPSLDYFNFVAEHGRDWLISSIGYEWLATQTGIEKFKPFAALRRYGTRAYKITTRNKSVIWSGPKSPDVPNQSKWIVHEPKRMRACDSCGGDFPCIQSSRMHGNLCCTCLAQTTRNAIDVLDLCAFRECKEISCANVVPISVVRQRQQAWRRMVDAEAG